MRLFSANILYFNGLKDYGSNSTDQNTFGSKAWVKLKKNNTESELGKYDNKTF